MNGLKKITGEKKALSKKEISGTDENGDWIMVSGSPPMYGYLYHKIVTVR
jgi:hypothetical protein